MQSNQTEILKLKNTMGEPHHSTESTHSQGDQAEETNSAFKVKSVWLYSQKKKRKKGVKEATGS